MEIINYEPTKVTPFVYLNPNEGIMEIKGRSSPKASVKFYAPIFIALDTIASRGVDNFTVNFALEYFNTSTSKCLFDLMRKIKSIQEKGSRVQVNWHFEEDDEDMKETGEDYESVLNLQFNYHPIAC